MFFLETSRKKRWWLSWFCLSFLILLSFWPLESRLKVIRLFQVSERQILFLEGNIIFFFFFRGKLVWMISWSFSRVFWFFSQGFRFFSFLTFFLVCLGFWVLFGGL